MKTPPPNSSGSLHPACSVLDRLRAHRGQMAPHQKDRNGGRLILDSITEIERLQDSLRRIQAMHAGICLRNRDHYSDEIMSEIAHSLTQNVISNEIIN